MKRFVPLVLYSIVLLVVFGGALWPLEGKILFGPDIWRYHYWGRQFLDISLKEGSIPWWNPFIFAGQPYLEHPQIPAWYLPILLFVLVPVNLAVSWYVALHMLWAMLGMYWLVRTLTPSGSRAAAWAAGVSFGLSSYFVGRIYAGHIDIIAASSWLPWVIGAFWQGRVVLTAVVFAMELLAGHQMVAVYTVEAIAIAAVILATVRRSLRPLLYAIVSVALGAGLAAVQILPNAQFVARSIRTMPLGQAWATIAAARPAHFLEFLDTGYFYKTIYRDIADDGFGHERSGYIGKIPLMMAVATILVVLVKRKKQPIVWAFLAMGVFSIWVWLGPNAPVDVFSIMKKTLPVYNQIRIPSRHIILFVFAGNALFGIGMGWIRNSFIRLALVGLVLVDLVPLAWQNIHVGTLPQQAEDRQLIALLSQDRGLTRFLPNFYHGEALRDVLEFDAPIVHMIYSVSGYDQPPLRNYWEFLLAVNNLRIENTLQYTETIPPFSTIRSPYLDFLNTRYILTPKESDSLGKYPDRFSLIKENNERGWRLYENKNVLPRFFFVRETKVLGSRAAIDQTIREGGTDPRRSVLVERTSLAVPPPSCTQDDRLDVSVLEYSSSVIRLATGSTCDATLVSSEVYYPGWQARIDGKKTRIVEGNLAFRTVLVPKGTHTVVLRYRPPIVMFGLLVSGAAAIGCFFWKRMLVFVT